MQEINTFQSEWLEMCQQLERQLKDTSVMRWLGRVIPEVTAENGLNLWAPSACICELIEQRYADAIRSLWHQKNPNTPVQFQLKKSRTISQTPVPEQKPLVAQITDSSLTDTKKVNSSGDTFVEYLDKSHTFDTFVVGEANEFAYAAAKQLADEETVSFNPLYFYADVGLGKTHLMHAMAWRIKEKRPDKNVLYLSAEQFFQRFIQGMQCKNTEPFKEIFRHVDVLLLDDIQFIASKTQTQEEFSQIFNALTAKGKKVILSAHCIPTELKGIGEGLKNRLSQGLVVKMKPASYELRLGILREKLSHMGTTIDEDVLSFLAKNITSNVRELEGALKRLVAHRQLLGGEITLENARQNLKDILQTTTRQVRAPEIQQAVADYYGLTIRDLRSTRRDRTIVRPRQLAMYLVRQMTPMAMPDIALFFEKENTTIKHAVETIENLLPRDKNLAHDKELIMEKLRQVK